MESSQSTRCGPRWLRCPECGSFAHHRPGNVYGCHCGCFTHFAGSEEAALALVQELKEADPEMEVILDYD